MDDTARKHYPIATGVLDYFPLAIAEVARVSYVGNDQHNPGSPLHWDRSKSTDEADALIRHFVERGTNDTDGMRHTAKVAWRALALLQKELEDAKLADAFPPSLVGPWTTQTVPCGQGTPSTVTTARLCLAEMPDPLHRWPHLYRPLCSRVRGHVGLHMAYPYHALDLMKMAEWDDNGTGWCAPESWR